ncbi:MAG: M20/M25/M40 family metallo-hydrolase, partial [Cyclobacteriaceae bacterium]|nr:M20/M25/M40 family metallo-hydrolase [Cyclobacteriaceae bacterium]
GLIVVLTVLRALEASNIRTPADLLFVGTVGEEGLGDLRGVKHIFEKNDPKIDAWISIDGGGIGPVNNTGLGSLRYKVTFKGPGGHSWGDFGLGNPHHVLGKAIDLFVESSTPLTSEGPATSFNVGRIGGGTSVNAIPFESWMEVDLRSVSPGRLSQIDSIFKYSMQKALDTYNERLAHRPALELQLEKIGYRPSGSIAPETALVQRGMAATRFFGIAPRLSTGSTNSNLPIHLGIPAITLGRGGSGGGAHSLGEWWLNNQGADAIKLALVVVLAEGFSH